MENQPVQPIIPESPIEVTPTNGEKPKKSRLIFVLIALAIFLLGITSCFTYQYFQTKRQIVSQPKQISTPTPISTVDPTADWKTYNKISFSVKAPHEYQYNEKISNEDLLTIENVIPVGKTPERGVVITFGYMSEVFKCDSNINCFNIIDASNKGAKSAGSKTITTQITATIAGETINGFRYVDPPSESSSLTHVRLFYPISHNGKFFELSINAFGKSEQEINNYMDSLQVGQIFSTFKFKN